MKKTRLFGLGLLVTMILFAYTVEALRVDAEKYRHWSHVKSMVIFDEKHPLFNPFKGLMSKICKIGFKKDIISIMANNFYPFLLFDK